MSQQFKGLQFKPHNWIFDLIKILAQILNNFLKFWPNEKNLIYVEIV
jgi:hypothetical protein